MFVIAKSKPKKKSKAGPIAVGIAALAAVGVFVPSDDAPEPEPTNPPAIVEETKIPDHNTVLDQISESEQSEPEPEQKEDPQPEKLPQETPINVDPEQAFRDLLMQYKYVGSSGSDKYHFPSCRWTKEINDTNLVHFDTEEEAAAAGYFPCGSCHP